MKKIFFAVFAAVACICLSCNNASTATKNSSLQQKNLEASHAINRAFETGDVSGIDSVVADDYVDHTDRGDMKGRDSLKAMVNFVRSNFRDMKMEIVHEVADGDYVFSWNRYTGTSEGSEGMPKGPYDMEAVEVLRFRDGKIMEHWSFMDMQDMMKMMG
ncbi:MAG: ester cyclase, partial [Chitinophagaceae bacterium]